MEVLAKFILLSAVFEYLHPQFKNNSNNFKIFNNNIFVKEFSPKPTHVQNGCYVFIEGKKNEFYDVIYTHIKTYTENDSRIIFALQYANELI